MDAENRMDKIEVDVLPVLTDMFGIDEADIQQKIGVLAEYVVHEMDAVDKLSKELISRKAALDAAKETLNHTLTQAGMKSCKLECGLNPSVKTDAKYYPVAGVSSPEFFEWLKDNDLGDIIKPTVNFNTAQSTLRAFEDQGNEVPESVVKKSLVYTIRMNGKAAYLAGKGK